MNKAIYASLIAAALIVSVFSIAATRPASATATATWNGLPATNLKAFYQNGIIEDLITAPPSYPPGVLTQITASQSNDTDKSYISVIYTFDNSKTVERRIAINSLKYFTATFDPGFGLGHSDTPVITYAQIVKFNIVLTLNDNNPTSFRSSCVASSLDGHTCRAIDLAPQPISYAKNIMYNDITKKILEIYPYSYTKNVDLYSN